MTKGSFFKFTTGLRTLKPLQKDSATVIVRSNHCMHLFCASNNIGRRIGIIAPNMSTAIEHGLAACEQGQRKANPNILDITNQGAIQVSSFTYACLLKGCCDLKSVTMGKRIHAHIIKTGYEANRV